MNPQIKKVLYHIETHLDDDLDLEYLSKLAGYSSYHFCRVFKINIGESAISYATRLKLERAAREMICADKSMIEIAFDAGYKTPTGFLKAFKLRFGTTPTDYKQGTLVLFNKYKEIKMNTPSIVTREAVDVVFTRELGDYMQSADRAWKRLTKQLDELEEYIKKNSPETKINIGEHNCESLGICYDDPKVTNEADLRYEAALVWDKEEIEDLKKLGFEAKSVAGGKYAMVDYLGISNGENAWYGLYAWIEKNGYTFRDEPAFEKYLNGDIETDLEKFEVEIYVPIE